MPKAFGRSTVGRANKRRLLTDQTQRREVKEPGMHRAQGGSKGHRMHDPQTQAGLSASDRTQTQAGLSAADRTQTQKSTAAAVLVPQGDKAGLMPWRASRPSFPWGFSPPPSWSAYVRFVT
jgi:hypothetical protein